MFYTIRQNNSGGYYINNKYVAEVIIVEANSDHEARVLLENITDDYSEYCECCGYRWNLDFGAFGISQGKEEPCVYNKPIKEYLLNEPWYIRIIVYYLNGDKIEYTLDNVDGERL